MQEEYSVQLGQRRIGCARIRREGLYCHVVCACEMPEQRVYILCGDGCGETVRLGIPAPKDGKLYLDRKIPLKRFPQKIDAIYLLEKDGEKPKDGILLREGAPVSGLENLIHSKLQFTPDGVLLVGKDVTLQI